MVKTYLAIEPERKQREFGMNENEKDHKRTSIKTNVKNMLWLRAAGRCEFRGCNKRLWLDDLTKDPCNQANIAHIVSDSPNGPRGDVVRSPLLAQDINNLMLMCLEHHNLIDHSEHLSEYPEDVLVKMKIDHEKRIELLTGLKEEMEIHTVVYRSNIGSTSPQVDAYSIRQALLPNYYPADNPIEIEWSGVRDKELAKYWQDEVRNLVYQYNECVKNSLERWSNKRIALFALAPMPLLVKLGSLLSDKVPVEVFQKHRDPDSWEWFDGEETDYIINPPEDDSKEPALVFSLSYDITDRVRKFYGAGSSIWEFRINSPNNNFLKSRKQLTVFRKRVYEVLDKISRRTQKQSIKVFMSMPVACAVELGRVWMKKADLALDLYDYDTSYSEKDEFAFTIR